jgi:hypothetical protein
VSVWVILRVHNMLLFVDDMPNNQGFETRLLEVRSQSRVLKLMNYRLKIGVVLVNNSVEIL